MRVNNIKITTKLDRIIGGLDITKVKEQIKITTILAKQLAENVEASKNVVEQINEPEVTRCYNEFLASIKKLNKRK